MTKRLMMPPTQQWRGRYFLLLSLASTNMHSSITCYCTVPTNDDDALYFPKWPAGGMNEKKEKKQHQHDLMQDPRRFESIQRPASLYPFLSKPFEQYWGDA
jgi:hypothetical protein